MRPPPGLDGPAGFAETRPVAAPEATEWIEAGGLRLALVVRRAWRPERTTFLTDAEDLLQAGGVVYPKGGVVTPHDHRPLERRLGRTSEALLVWRGRCEIDLYDEARRKVAVRTLEEGDLILLLSGGHGFRMLEDTVLFEIKQGPYTGIDEKERF